MNQTLTITIIALASLFSGCTTNQSTSYEYKAMSLIEMFKDDPEANKKISELMVQVKGHFNRTDMDVSDYTRALNRIEKEGWTLVTVNKSNYWIFKRPKK